MGTRHEQRRRTLVALGVGALGLVGSGCVAPSTPCGGPLRTPPITQSSRASTSCDSSRMTRTAGTTSTPPVSPRATGPPLGAPTTSRATEPGHVVRLGGPPPRRRAVVVDPAAN
jgi:hypothetical protein